MISRHQSVSRTWPDGTLSVPGFEVTSGVHEPASVLNRHTHELPSICCVKYGSFTEYYPGKAVGCDARTLKITPAGEPHWNRFDSVSTYGLRIDVDAGRFADVPEIARMLDERLFMAAAAFELLTRQLVVELLRGDAISRVAAEGLLLELIAKMASLAGETGRPRWLRQADDILHERAADPPTVAALAQQVGVPATRLARSFRSEFGCTVAQRVRQLRLDSAALELVTSVEPIARVATRAGFYDQSHFSNAFRRHFGITPASYREQRGVIRRESHLA
jgi:AraC family transcriptional regulator